jgi:hypothetical protein
MRSSSDTMPVGPTGRRRSFQDGAPGQDQDVSESIQPRDNVVAFPMRPKRDAFDEALDHAEAALGEARYLLHEIEERRRLRFAPPQAV